MINWRRLVVVLAILSTVMSIGGCLAVVAAGGAAGGVAYAKGDLEAVLDGTPKQIARASNSALKGMDLHVITSKSSDIDGEITARTGQDKKVTIRFKKLTESTTKLSIRVGTFGDEVLSRSIYDKIRASL